MNTRQREPIEITVSAILIISGLAQLVGGAAPGSIAEYLPGLFRVVWVGTMIAGGVAVLLSFLLRDIVTALYTEMVGLLAMSVSIGVYSVAIMYLSFSLGNSGKILSGPITLGLALGFYFRYRQLRRLTKRLPTK